MFCVTEPSLCGAEVALISTLLVVDDPAVLLAAIELSAEAPIVPLLIIVAPSWPALLVDVDVLDPSDVLPLLFVEVEVEPSVLELDKPLLLSPPLDVLPEFELWLEPLGSNWITHLRSSRTRSVPSGALKGVRRISQDSVTGPKELLHHVRNKTERQKGGNIRLTCVRRMDFGWLIDLCTTDSRRVTNLLYYRSAMCVFQSGADCCNEENELYKCKR